MTTPVLSSAALDAIRPQDLSTKALHQRQSAVFSITPSRAPAGAGQPETVGLAREGFSLESIPLVGDFFSVISSLFSSFESAPSPAGPASGQLSDAIAGPPSLSGGTHAHLASEQDANEPLDLSRYLSNLDFRPTGTIDLVGDSETTPRSKSGSGSMEATDPTILPQITGLAAHPANKIPLDMLAQMQTRYLQMASEQD